MLIFLSVIYFLTLAYLVYLSIREGKSLKRFIVKAINCFLFIVIFLVSCNIENKLFIPLLVAFILSFIGDLGLGYYHVSKNKIHKLIGFLGFCFAQVTFITTFIYYFNYNLYLLFIPILGSLFGLFLVYKLNIKNKFIYILGFIYMNLVCMMLSSTISIFIDNFNTFGLVMFLGGLTFTISDYTLLLKYYCKSHKNLITFISVSTYGIAQYLFAISVLI